MVKDAVEAEKCCCRGTKPILVTGLGNYHDNHHKEAHILRIV